MQTLESLEILYCNCIDLSENNFVYFSKSLPYCHDIKTLSFSSININYYAFTVLCDNLKYLSNLKDLYISNNHLNDSYIIYLSDHFSDIRGLNELILFCIYIYLFIYLANDIKEEGMIEMCEKLTILNRITKISIGGMLYNHLYIIK